MPGRWGALLVAAAVLGATVGGAVPARASTTTNVTVAPSDNTVFTPSNITIAVGSYVHWAKAATASEHSVFQNAGIFHSVAPTTASFSLTVRFSAGVFRYYCQIHGSPTGGMYGWVRVPVLIQSAPSGLPFTVVWSTSGVNTGSSWDVQYRAGSSGTWRTWRSATTSRSRVFGVSGSPTSVHHGTTYQFRARSRKSVSGSTVASAWSPVKGFAP